MGDSMSWLSSLFGGAGNGATTSGLTTPMQAGVDITGNGNNAFQVPGVANQPSGLATLSSGVNALQSLASIYLGFQNANTAKNQAAQAQQNWDTQWAANVKTTNASLADRQAARVASNSKAYDSVDSYMSKYGIS